VTPGHSAFLLDPAEAAALAEAHPECAPLLHPYLTAEDLMRRPGSTPSRVLVDLHPLPLEALPGPLRALVEARVRPAREAAAAEETDRNLGSRRPARHHAAFLARWWWPSWPRAELKAALASLPRYLACPRYIRRPVLAFVDPAVRPADLLVVFALSDDFSFGILQSAAHAAWLVARGSALLGTPRYTSASVFDTFPWPSDPSPERVEAVAEAGRELRRQRDLSGMTLAALEARPTAAVLRAQADLDRAVELVYGWVGPGDTVARLLALNREQAEEGGPGRDP
jgi:hypothetical protein